MTNITLLLFFLLRFPTQQTSETLFYIQFEDFFREDTVSVYINGNMIADNVVLTSDRSTGLTWLSLDLQRDSVFIIASVLSNGIVQSNMSFESLEKNSLLVICNTMESQFFLELDKGKYVGVYKNNDSVKFRQSKMKFMYD